jgi:hypothetical protein
VWVGISCFIFLRCYLGKIMFLFLTITLSLVITIFSFIHLPSSSYADNEKYLNCSAPFDCAGKEGLNYPFWGSNRPNYCGHPAFELNCSEGAPLIKITNHNYRILDVYNVSRTLKVVNQDYESSAVCRSMGFNNTAIDFTFFDYDSATTNLTLYYICSDSFPFLPHTTRFECSVSVDRTYKLFTNNYCLNSTIANLNGNSLEGLCQFNVTVPILQSAAQTGSNCTDAGLIEAIDGGFMLRWDANNSLCDGCQATGGQCGYNTSTSEFACFVFTTGTYLICCFSYSGNGERERQEIFFVSLYGQPPISNGPTQRKPAFSIPVTPLIDLHQPIPMCDSIARTTRLS